jgi:hypothetical protein
MRRFATAIAIGTPAERVRIAGWVDHETIPDLQPVFDTFASDLKRAAERVA